MAATGRTIYMCRECHRVGQRRLTCHPRASVKCNAGMPGDERSKPLFDAQGNLITRAPRWWVEACFRSQKAKTNQKVTRHLSPGTGLR